jgi:hypothetical protein
VESRGRRAVPGLGHWNLQHGYGEKTSDYREMSRVP